MENSQTLLPGSIAIRPTRQQAECEPDDFYSLLDALRGPESLPLRKIAEVVGDTSLNPEPNTLRKIQSQTLPDQARRHLLRHIFDEAQLLSGKMRRQLARMDDAFYFAFLNQFHIDETSQDDARAKVTGTYKFWRYAADNEGEYILGKLTCFEDPKSHALKVTLLMKQTSPEHHVDWHLSGYLFCLDQTILTIVRRPNSGEIRVALLPRFRMSVVGTAINPRSVFAGKQSHIVHMDGVTLGIDKRSCFLSPVHLSLVDDVDELARLDQAVDVVSEGDARLPARILNKLKRHGPLKWL
jgi:hypothetical protein